MTQPLLIVVDLQNDFCPGGALAVPEGDQIVPLVNQVGDRFQHVILTQDWHPSGHDSFASSHDGKAPFETYEAAYGTQVLWPDHCVQNSHGAAFHGDLDLPHAELVLRKGFRTGEVMVDLVTSRDAEEEVRPFAEALLERHPEVTTLVQNVNSKPASIAVALV